MVIYMPDAYVGRVYPQLNDNGAYIYPYDPGANGVYDDWGPGQSNDDIYIGISGPIVSPTVGDDGYIASCTYI